MVVVGRRRRRDIDKVRIDERHRGQQAERGTSGEVAERENVTAVEAVAVVHSQKTDVVLEVDPVDAGVGEHVEDRWHPQVAQNRVVEPKVVSRR